MGSSSSHVFMFSTILILLVSHSMAANAPSKLVHDVCKDVEANVIVDASRSVKYDECVGILQLDPRTTASANLTSLAEITTQLGISHARNTRHLIRNELKIHRAPSVKEKLAFCHSEYGDVIDMYKIMRRAIITKNIVEPIEFEVGLFDPILMCERAIGEIKAPPSFPKLARRNYVAEKFVQIALVLIHRLLKNA